MWYEVSGSIFANFLIQESIVSIRKIAFYYFHYIFKFILFIVLFFIISFHYYFLFHNRIISIICIIFVLIFYFSCFILFLIVQIELSEIPLKMFLGAKTTVGVAEAEKKNKSVVSCDSGKCFLKNGLL